jgi:glycerophosphoryl diester phosphodiesterase
MTASFFSGLSPRLFAHRGASGEAPENTLAAFRRAVALGIEYIELDVHVSRDGHVMVIHDVTLERTTNGSGTVREQTLAQLQQWDAGHRFSSDGGATFPFRAVGVTVPTLAEVFQQCPGVKFTVEIKPEEPAIEEQVIAVVRACGREADVILASEHDRVLQRVRSFAPDLATSLAYGEVFDFIQRVATGELADYHPPGHAIQIPPEFQGVSLVTEHTLAVAHEFDCEMHVWTINDAHEMARLLALGVDGVMSDFPGLLLDVARRHFGS